MGCKIFMLHCPCLRGAAHKGTTKKMPDIQIGKTQGEILMIVYENRVTERDDTYTS